MGQPDFTLELANFSSSLRMQQFGFIGSRGSEMAAALLFWTEHLPVHI
jgi:hypothetical protein